MQSKCIELCIIGLISLWFSFDFVVVPSEEIERENERLQKVAASENTECKIFYFMKKRCRNIM